MTAMTRLISRKKTRFTRAITRLVVREEKHTRVFTRATLLLGKSLNCWSFCHG